MVSDIVVEAMRKALRALRACGVEPVLVGGMAIQYHGRVRQTKDADFLAVIEESQFEDLFRAAGAEGLSVDVRRPVLRIGDDTILRLLFVDPKYRLSIRIDVIRAWSEFLRQVVGRGVPVEAYGDNLRLATCEDLILLKLLAGRPIDRVDAAELLRENLARLDEAYLNRWAETLRLVDELEEAKRESREDEA